MVLCLDASIHESSRADFCSIRYGKDAKQFTQFMAITPPNTLTPIYDSRTDEPVVEKLNFTAISYEWYRNNFALQSNQMPIPIDGTLNTDSFLNFGNNLRSESVSQNDNTFGNNFDLLKKYKKWPIKKPEAPFDQIYGRRVKKHVGLHNGDSIQRVISTGTLAPSLKAYSEQDQLPVDGSIDVIFATYSFPASTNVHRMSDSMQSCVQSYLTKEKETELRLLDENSAFKQMNYDHDAYVAAVNEICAKKSENIDYGTDQQQQQQSNDPVKANDWIREMGSMTIHRVNLKCFNHNQNRQIPIKEYKYQRWPSYLGIMADAVANVIDE